MSFQSQKQVSGFTTQASYLVLALIICSMFSGIFSIVFNPFRLAFISNTLVGFLALNGILMIGFASVAVAFWHKLRIWPIEGLLFLSLVGSIVFSDYQKYSLTNIVIDLARPALFLVVVITIRSLVDLKTLSKSNLLHQLFVVNVYATVFSVVVCYVINAYVVPLYPAYSTIDSVLGMGWLVATQSPVIQSLYGIVLIASGKRGVYIAVGLAILIAYRTKEVFWVLLCAVGVISVLIMIVFPELQNQLQAFLFKGAVDLNRLSVTDILRFLAGGRLEEIEGALAASEGSTRYLFGASLGFEYPSAAFPDDGDSHRNLHFTPAGIVVYYGGIFAFFLVIYFARIARIAFKLTLDKKNPTLLAYSVYFISSLIFSMTEYSIFVYLNLAVSCGLLGAATRQFGYRAVAGSDLGKRT